MRFVHDDPDFGALLAAVADATGLAVPLVEKDYWVTHTLWGLHASGLDVWFKGGTSLSKGFDLIARFSEDLDLMVQRGRVTTLPEVRSWTSRNPGPVANRFAFYHALTTVLAVPGMVVERDARRADRWARGADFIARYPTRSATSLPAPISPGVRLEIGRARVVPWVERPITSFVHDHLHRLGLSEAYADNRPAAVRCVHPVVTLLEKLDALTRRYGRATIEADAFVRHYEDAAHIVRAMAQLPSSGVRVPALIREMLADRDLAAPPTASAPALLLDDPDKRAGLEQAHARIAPMFWGPRLSLDEACRILREWVSTVHP